MKNNFFVMILSITLVSGSFLISCDQPSNGSGNNTFSVSYNANGGSGAVPGPQTAPVNSIVYIAGPGGLMYAGKTFTGWNTTPDGTGGAYTAGSSLTVNGNITLYAQWQTTVIPSYTLSYNANGGSGAVPDPQTAETNTGITVAGPGGLTYTGKTFTGWNTTPGGTGDFYAAGSSLTVNGNITLYAQWKADIIVEGASLGAKLSWLQTNAASNTRYIIEVNANESTGPQTLSWNGKDNIHITIIGIGDVRTINLNTQGSMFTIGTGVTLVLENNITLQGLSYNNVSLVRVNIASRFEMKGNTKITGNTNSSSSAAGGGVNVTGTFVMSDYSSVSGNRATASGSLSSGGGVYINSGGVFVLQGSAAISNNTTYSSSYAASGGAGVYNEGTFTMRDNAVVSGNSSTAYNPAPPGHTGVWNPITRCFGGGVSNLGTFRMAGGTIYGTDVPGQQNAVNSLFSSESGSAWYGFFNDDSFISRGSLTTTNTTLAVVNGYLQ
jgi:uncharacterized repeat protein (TIGR02543 family)